jgi:hypothetical protein
LFLRAMLTSSLYPACVQNLPPISQSPVRSFLWWRHPFFRMAWKQWRLNWLKLADRIPANHPTGPAGLLRSLKESHCDPDVALRLAFLTASKKPVTKSELVGQNARQQKIKRKLNQARDYLRKAVFGGKEASLPELANDNKTVRKLGECRNQIQKAARELEQAMSNIPLIFIKPKDVELLKASVEPTNPLDVALWIRLQDLATMCDHEIETLLWPRAVELGSRSRTFHIGFIRQGLQQQTELSARERFAECGV